MSVPGLAGRASARRSRSRSRSTAGSVTTYRLSTLLPSLDMPVSSVALDTSTVPLDRLWTVYCGSRALDSLVLDDLWGSSSRGSRRPLRLDRAAAAAAEAVSSLARSLSLLVARPLTTPRSLSSRSRPSPACVAREEEGRSSPTNLASPVEVLVGTIADEVI